MWKVQIENMSLQLTETLYKIRPVIYEGIIIIVIGMLVVANTTITDIKFHDFYVKPTISTCYPENQSDFCQTVRANMGLEKNAQLEIGDVYWKELARQAIMIGFILFMIRISFAILLHKARMQNIEIVTIFVAIMWGVVASGLFLFGFLDTFYYWIQGTDIESTLGEDQQMLWLDGAGIFTETKSFTGTPDHVELMDLYLTNLLGLAVVGVFWLITMVLYAESGRRKKNIA